jgi:hypothetical protein
MTKNMKIQNLCEKVNLKNPIFNLKSELTPSDFENDNFLFDMISLLEKNNFVEEVIENLSINHNNRYEVSFFKICFYFNELKSSSRDSKFRNNSLILREKIMKELIYSSERLKKNEFLLESEVGIYIFKPFQLLKLWFNYF